MKTFNRLAFIGLLGLLFLTVDYSLGTHEPIELGTVVHKTFAPPGTYHPVKNPVPHHVIVIVQSHKQRGYWVSVPRDEFYDIDVGDKIPISKDYGLITGWEYSQQVFIEDDDNYPPGGRKSNLVNEN